MSMAFSLWMQRSQELSPAEFQQLCASAEILEQDAHGLKVLRLDNGDMLKIFRVKRAFSSARIYSYARRFCRNADRLRKLGIPTVTPKQLFHFSDSANSAVLYAPLQGATLRELSRISKMEESLLISLGGFIAKLHSLGIYFRSLHFGNIVLTPDGKFGLIDVADMLIFRRALSCGRRSRNFRHVRRVSEDMRNLGSRGWEILMDGYLSHDVSTGCANKLRQKLALSA